MAVRRENWDIPCRMLNRVTNSPWRRVVSECVRSENTSLGMLLGDAIPPLGNIPELRMLLSVPIETENLQSPLATQLLRTLQHLLLPIQNRPFRERICSKHQV